MPATAARQLLCAWNLPETAALRPITSGTNNVNWAVHPSGNPDDPHGARILRIHQNAFTRESLLWEHELLTHLAQERPSFAVPAPVPTPRGETLVPAPGLGPQRSDVWASLYPLLHGRQPEPGDTGAIRPLGAALGELIGALERVSPSLPDRKLPPYGRLDGVHPLIPDPHAVPSLLKLERDESERLTRIIRDAWDAAPALYAALPQQVIHSDFVRSNTLMLGGRVTAVLDFEFAGQDLRAMDLATALYHVGGATGRRDGTWEQSELLVRGIAEHFRPLPAEVEALPLLLRLRMLVIVLHWTGKWRQDAAPIGEPLDCIRDLFTLDSWLQDRGLELVSRVSGAFAP
jgi:homoserine kinase type II